MLPQKTKRTGKLGLLRGALQRRALPSGTLARTCRGGKNLTEHRSKWERKKKKYTRREQKKRKPKFVDEPRGVTHWEKTKNRCNNRRNQTALVEKKTVKNKKN